MGRNPRTPRRLSGLRPLTPLERGRLRPYITRMRRYMLPALFSLSLALPLQAQDSPAVPEDDTPSTSVFDFLERMLRGFMTEVEPQMRELERGFEALEPELQGFLERLRGMTQYHPPEVLPNGDILIRRRDAEEQTPDAPDQAPLPDTPFEL